MQKFAVFSGFLGSGKTTAMMALTRLFSAKFGKAAMITNDLGGQGLADNRLARLSGCNAYELTGKCICYQTENLVSRLKHLFITGECDLVISDIPGFGVGALKHVYHTLREQYSEVCELAPFTVLVEPCSVEKLRRGRDCDYAYILKAQLKEADLIVLNKCDLLRPAEQRLAQDFLRQCNPSAEVICISALTGQGLEQLAQRLTNGSASLRNPDIGYGGVEFTRVMDKVSEFNMQYYATVCCNDFDGNSYLLAIAEDVQARISGTDGSIPHLKLLAWNPEGEYGKVDLLEAGRPVEINHRFVNPCKELAVVLNASAFFPPEQMDDMLSEAIETVSNTYQLSLSVYKKECFGLGG